MRPLDERFEEKVTKTDRCWVWTAGRMNAGYGVIGRGPRSAGLVLAHRLAYEIYIGPIPAGMTIDHLCHTWDEDCPGGNTCPHRACVNPAHLEAVTLAENKARGRSRSAINARKTHCVHGHLFDEKNTYIGKNGRTCRTCRRERQRIYNIQKEGSAA